MPKADSTHSPLILLHGDDDFGVRARARQLFEEWSREAGGEDHEIIDAQCANSGEALKSIGRLREALNTLPFFGGSKVVWWQHCNFLGDERTATAQAVSEATAELARELKEFDWRNVRLLISAGKVDKRKSFYKTLEKTGAVEVFEAWSLDDKGWQANAENLVRQHLKDRGVRASEEALAEMVGNVGPHRQQLMNELEKITAFLGERKEMTRQDVQAVVTRNKQARAFALGDALGQRDLPGLLRTLDEELWEMQFDRKKSEIGLLYGLISKVRMMIFLKELQREKWLRPVGNYSQFKAELQRIPTEAVPEDKRFNPLAMNPYPLFKALDHARNYTVEELVRAMSLLLQCNQRLIFSALEGRLILQQTLLQIVRPNDPHPGSSQPLGKA
jgi:DNA polymerase III subunit delta